MICRDRCTEPNWVCHKCQQVHISHYY